LNPFARPFPLLVTGWVADWAGRFCFLLLFEFFNQFSALDPLVSRGSFPPGGCGDLAAEIDRDEASLLFFRAA
jgi:hypothetical protein